MYRPMRQRRMLDLARHRLPLLQKVSSYLQRLRSSIPPAAVAIQPSVRFSFVLGQLETRIMSENEISQIVVKPNTSRSESMTPIPDDDMQIHRQEAKVVRILLVDDDK